MAGCHPRKSRPSDGSLSHSALGYIGDPGYYCIAFCEQSGCI